MTDENRDQEQVDPGHALTVIGREAAARRAREIQHAVWLVAGLTLLMILAVAALAVVGYVSNRHRLHEIERGRIEARLTICRELNKVKTATREGLMRQVSDSKVFLRKNPRGIPGIPPRLIRLGIRRLEFQIAQNADVDCRAFAFNPGEIVHKPPTEPVVTIRGVPIPRRGD